MKYIKSIVNSDIPTDAILITMEHLSSGEDQEPPTKNEDLTTYPQEGQPPIRRLGQEPVKELLDAPAGNEILRAILARVRNPELRNNLAAFGNTP